LNSSSWLAIASFSSATELAGQLAAVPAGDEPESVLVELRPQRIDGGWHAGAEFDPLEPDLPDLGEALVDTDVGADLWAVAVEPADGGHAEAGHLLVISCSMPLQPSPTP
jgi:hypothetical protein